jgi:hypothetical protein
MSRCPECRRDVPRYELDDNEGVCDDCFESSDVPIKKRRL